MRELLSTFINALLSAQADAACGAEYDARPQRIAAEHHRSGLDQPTSRTRVTAAQ
jgi:transposase-like protein